MDLSCLSGSNIGIPTERKCYCNISFAIPGIPVDKKYSCQRECGRRKSCGHFCSLKCHPGTCHDCSESVEASCHCEKQKRKISCSKSLDAFSCNAKCGRMLNCAMHKCKLICHSGKCPDCTVKTSGEKYCHCRKSKKTFFCPEKPVNFNCSFACGKLLDCEKHRCEIVCHSTISNCSSVCTKRNATKCYCGKSQLGADLRKSLLKDCEFSISCGQKCQKTMKCGHRCQQICHQMNVIPTNVKKSPQKLVVVEKQAN